MKKIQLIVLLSLLCGIAHAQILTAEDFEQYSVDEYDGKEDGRADYVAAALSLSNMFTLDKNNQLTRISVVDCPNKDKNKIYIEANNWFTSSFNDGQSVIQLNDKESGVILAKGFLKNIVSHVSAMTSADVSVWMIIRIDIKDHKFRLTTTIQSYSLKRGTGVIGAMNGHGNVITDEWLPSQYYPFVDKDEHSRQTNKTSAKAFVASCIYSEVVADKLTEAILHGITGVEDDDW